MVAHPPTITLGHFIGGRIVPGASARCGAVGDPATGSVSKHVSFAARDDVDAAVVAAKTAFPRWSELPAHRRAAVLFAFRELLRRDTERLAHIITSEHGKTLADAAGEIARGTEVVEFACGIPHLLKGEFSENVGSGIDSYCLRQPLGVCAGISPFNFPAMVPLWMLPVALACGNTFVMKPSEKDPSLALELAALLVEAGLPDGVLNVVNGDKETVTALLDHPDVAAVSFVGSTAVAEFVHTRATANGKRVQALGGAKNHLVVMPDADIDGVADALMGSAYGSAGERCMAISIAVVVGDTIADALVERLDPKISALHIGPGTDPTVEMGPLITREHRAKVCSYIELAESEGATLAVDGRRRGFSAHTGHFLGGTLLDHVTPAMRVYKEEIFGPVLGIVRVETFEDALRIVNAHEYGNGVAIFTRDGETARTFVSAVAAGMVGVNVPIPVPMAFHSFGGWKRSFFGDHAVHGPEGVRFYTRIKTVTSRWPSGARSRADYVMPT
ncbi:MAG: CoA-acylating methylmalonate-semialdehyde dehydrogenase [Candidatus Eremiobacteraeota bacterium]|nr:CoA-acylating methylmalonate-semialdehyde dehydrogenase [Candidatus Eremiobacteraeota bacterium]